MPCVIRMPRQDRHRAINLLGQNYPRKLMRQRHPSQRQHSVRPQPGRRGPAIRRPNCKHQPLRPRIAQRLQVPGELLRAVLLSPAIQQNRVCRGAPRLAFEPLQQRRLSVKDLRIAWQVSCSPLHVIRKQPVSGLGLRP